MIVIVDSGGDVSHLTSMWSNGIVVSAKTALDLARRPIKPDLIVLAASPKSPGPAGIWVSFTQIRVPVIAICFASQCLAASLGDMTYLKDTSRDLRRSATSKTGNGWIITRPPPGSRNVKWYKHAVGVDAVAEFTYRNVRAFQYRIDLTKTSLSQIFGEYIVRGGGDGGLGREYMDRVLVDHAEGAKWFSLPAPGNVRRIMDLTSMLKVVYIDHEPEDDPTWVIDFPKVFQRMLDDIARHRPGWGPPTDRLVVVKSFSDQRRTLPPSGEYPKPINVNGGVHFSQKDAIHVYRSEGSVKVSIHEAIHWTGLEHHLEPIKEAVPACIEGYTSFTEAWVEFQAARFVCGGGRLAMRRERDHVFARCASILRNMGYDRPNEFLVADRCSCKRIDVQKSDIFSYFFLRASIFMLPEDKWSVHESASDVLVRAVNNLKTSEFTKEIKSYMARKSRDRSLTMTTSG